MLSAQVIMEAKHAVICCQARGLLYSPEDAWAVAGNHEMETLWSIANRVALERDSSPEELCDFLERIYPYCSFKKSRIDKSIWSRGEGIL